jgi:hypothetical protein
VKPEVVIRTSLSDASLEAELDRAWAEVRAELGRRGEELPEGRSELFTLEPREMGSGPVVEFLLKVAEASVPGIVSGLVVAATTGALKRVPWAAVLEALKRVRWREGRDRFDFDETQKPE